ncbi:MAG: hypothetical protein KIT84_26655 [Labilithrix sp.]|nr:hypothetical protein [Labilithrix sp.]MCW5814635.1 hypothetical protein [Labilithrix sp.]
MKSEPAVAAATVAAAATIAQQVIGKATRDAMFLSHYSPQQLPLVMIASSIVSIGVIAAMTAALRKRGPLMVVPAAFALHALLAAGEWGLSAHLERAVAIAVYIHTASVGATIVSAFWSVVSEAFDPHTAKQVVGRIGAGAALGGVVGGAIAWVSSRLTASVPTMLLVVAGLSVISTWGIRTVAKAAPRDEGPKEDLAPKGLGALRDTPYLQLLALIVLAGAVTQSLVEYALGTEATKAYGGGARLLSFFAVFQTAIGVLSFILQLSVNRIALEKLGVGPTLALLPLGVVGLGALALGYPLLATFSLQRGAEGVLRASLFRSAYEVLFAPVPQASKRAAKTVIDVGFDRIGMVLGSALTLGLIAWVPHDTVQAVTISSIAAGAFSLVIAYQLQRGYVATLADRLRSGKLVFAESDVVDATTRHTLSQTTQGLDRSVVLAQIEAMRRSKAAGSVAPRYPIPENPEIEATAGDDRVQLMADLRSPDDRVVERALGQDVEHLAPLAFELLELLGRDRVAARARRVLKPLVPRLVGTIVDFILDDRRDAAARRRAARLLGSVPSQRVVDSLSIALDATDLGIRYAAGRALVRMRERVPELKFDYYATRARARHELELRDGGGSDARHLEHAFNLLSLVFPMEPTQLAYGAIVGNDAQLRGIALEYLENTLPPQERAAIQRTLETVEADRTSLVPGAPALDQLVEKRDAIRLELDALRRERDGEPAQPS